MISLIRNIMNRKNIKNARRINGVIEYSYGTPLYEDGEFVLCESKYGKTLLLQMFVETPREPGDQHFYNYKKICYVETPNYE